MKGNEEVRYNIKVVRKRVKNFNLRVKSNLDVILSVPLRATDAQVEKYIELRDEWIKEKVKYFKELGIKKYKYVEDEDIFYLGYKFRLILKESKKNECILEDDKFVMHVKNTNDFKLKDKVINDFYKNKAKLVFQRILDDTLNRFNEENNIKLYIRKMKSIWGNCNRYKNKITLNSRLIMQDLSFIEYVIAHEVAHLRHMDHSKDFYRWLSFNMPDWEERMNKQIPVLL